ncbi:hypothetical protein QUH73_20245 [Labilibaculum sp. K2S]|uniref:hypothetical protein n=1 Tax=Labilibaculum sp. K2S TaxID=3056386 RepID=UPI0025A392D9|nr:hypothetical protein [Labilibaculum sp. K2S]MDM8162161.1 hypothetical protein [Labilibaculum sp. K2S]
MQIWNAFTSRATDRIDNYSETGQASSGGGNWYGTRGGGTMSWNLGTIYNYDGSINYAGPSKVVQEAWADAGGYKYKTLGDFYKEDIQKNGNGTYYQKTLLEGTDKVYYNFNGRLGYTEFPKLGAEWKNISPVSTYSDMINNWWNTHWTAKLIPDVIYLNLSAGSGGSNGGVGADQALGYALPLRGKQAFNLYSYSTYSNKKGYQIGTSFNIGYSVYIGADARNFDFVESFGGFSSGWEDDIILGVSHSTSSVNSNGDYLISNSLGWGAAVGVVNTKGVTNVYPIF